MWQPFHWNANNQKKVQEKKEHNIKMRKEQVYSDGKHYHVQYDKHKNNVTALHLSGITEKGQH